MTGCAYNKGAREFRTGHLGKVAAEYKASLPAGTIGCNYFPGMVQVACQEARKQLQRIQAIKVRNA